MTEDQLQSKIVKRHSETFGAERNGCLFHIPNERNNKFQAMISRAKGIFPGVSDLIEIYDGRILCLELKAVGSRHNVYQLKRQVRWGKVMESNGGIWRLVTDVDDAMMLFKGGDAGMTTTEIERKINGIKTKTIKI